MELAYWPVGGSRFYQHGCRGDAMTKAITMTETELEQYHARQRKANGLPDFESEAEFQAECERWLRQCGFRSRTPANIATHHGKLWYIHLHKTKKNPIIADFILLNSKTLDYIEIDIKNGDTELTTDQKYLYKRGEILICRNMDSFKNTVMECFCSGLGN